MVLKKLKKLKICIYSGGCSNKFYNTHRWGSLCIFLLDIVWIDRLLRFTCGRVLFLVKIFIMYYLVAYRHKWNEESGTSNVCHNSLLGAIKGATLVGGDSGGPSVYEAMSVVLAQYVPAASQSTIFCVIVFWVHTKSNLS